MSKSGFGKFFAGAAIGLGLGVLFAPQSGENNRKELKKKLDELVDQAKKVDVEEVKKDIMRKVEDIKMELVDLDKEKALEIAKEKGDVLKKKAQELRNNIAVGDEITTIGGLTGSVVSIDGDFVTFFKVGEPFVYRLVKIDLSLFLQEKQSRCRKVFAYTSDFKKVVCRKRFLRFAVTHSVSERSEFIDTVTYDNTCSV